MLNRLRAIVGGRRAAPPSPRREVPLAAYQVTLRARLKGLPSRTQAALAAACAERLYPSYAAFLNATGRDDAGLVRQALDLAWEGAKTGRVPHPDPRSLVERCIALIPDDDAEGTIPAHADDSVAAAAYALQAAAGLDAGAAGWAAERVTNTLDTFVLSTDVDAAAPDADRRVWEHPLVKAEVSRREDDLRRLDSTVDWSDAVDTVRATATGASALPLERLDHRTDGRL